MNYYDDNKNTEYHDSFYVPKTDNTYKEKRIKEKKQINKISPNKKILLISIFILLIVLILIIGIVFFSLFKNNTKEKYLENIIIEKHKYLPEFDNEIYDYYLLTSDSKINIDCKISRGLEVSGCDEEIDLSNYNNYIHQIIVNDKTIYNIHIKVKEYKDEKTLAISSIDGLDDYSSRSKRISIQAESVNEIKEYSFDNGETYQQSNSILIEENQVLDIIVKDEYDNISPVKRVYVENIDKTLPTGTIIKEKASSKEITLKVIAKDEESGIKSYSWNNESEKNSIKVNKPGIYSVIITDKAGNESEEITIEIDDSDFTNKKQLSALFYLNGSDGISDNYLVCTTTNTSCNITLPTIERESSEIIGWSTKKDAKKAEYQPNEKIELNKNIKLYAITKKKVNATFEENGVDSLSSNKEECTYYNDNKFCYITVPKINYNNGKIVGFNISPNSDTLLISPNSKIKVYDDITYYALAFKNITISFNKNGADSISSTKQICRIEKGSTTCTVTTPNINREKSNIIGWSTDMDATTALIMPNSEIEVNNNKTYYAITKKNITISFNKNGADSVGATSLSCSIYNSKKTCTIKMPTIKRNDSIILGWNSNKNSKSAEIEENDIITVDKNKTYYAISFKEVNAYFKPNGVDSISSTSEKCTYYNDENGCIITTPDILRDDWTVVGWHTNQNSTTALTKENSELSIKNTTTYYAITYKELSVTLEKNNADSLETCQKQTSTGCISSCKIYNQNTSCKVNLPYIYSKGNEVQYYSTSSDPSTKSGYTPVLPLTIKGNVKLYAIVDNRYRKNTYSIIKTKNYGYTAFETESGCPSSVYNNYYAFTDRAYSKVPYIFRASKVTFSGNNTFDDTWGNYSGMTYGGGLGYRNVDVKCPNTYSTYYLHTIIHELVHSWDNYYKAQKGLPISENSDVKALYNKYKNAKTRPLRDYSYTNYGEFIADMYSWYYFLYIDTTQKLSIVSQNTYYPSDMKKVIEKYITIAKNGYK